jgi:hypothetical protein
MLEELALLPPVQAALDQIVQHFGTDVVAEVTGRSRRIVKRNTLHGPVLSVQNRPASSNLAETQSFMDDRKRILVFSDAGGTGRSYHADLGCLNQRPACTTFWRLDGKPTPPSKGSDAHTGPTRNSHRCSDPSQPMCAVKSVSSPPSPAGSTA